jgi:hypothetical protein
MKTIFIDHAVAQLRAHNAPVTVEDDGIVILTVENGERYHRIFRCEDALCLLLSASRIDAEVAYWRAKNKQH